MSGEFQVFIRCVGAKEWVPTREKFLTYAKAAQAADVWKAREYEARIDPDLSHRRLLIDALEALLWAAPSTPHLDRYSSDRDRTVAAERAWWRTEIGNRIAALRKADEAEVAQ